jgi:hypothetical protein
MVKSNTPTMQRILNQITEAEFDAAYRVIDAINALPRTGGSFLKLPKRILGRYSALNPWGKSEVKSWVNGVLTHDGAYLFYA